MANADIAATQGAIRREVKVAAYDKSRTTTSWSYILADGALVENQYALTDSVKVTVTNRIRYNARGIFQPTYDAWYKVQGAEVLYIAMRDPAHSDPAARAAPRQAGQSIGSSSGSQDDYWLKVRFI